MATELVPFASENVPIASAISPAVDFTPSATAPCPDFVLLYLSNVCPSLPVPPARIDPLPVVVLNILFRLAVLAPPEI